MITYSQFGLHNRAGNYLFQYSGLLRVAKKHGMNLVLPDYYLWKFFKNQPNISNIVKGDNLFHFRNDGLDLEFVDEYFSTHKDKSVEVNLNPYLQSEKWFLDEKDYILEMLKFKEEEVDKIKEQYKQHLSKKTIGIGVRLGIDYKTSRDFFQIPYRWFLQALETNFPTWRDTHQVIIFSDNIEQAKLLFKDKGFLYAEHNQTSVMRYDKEHFHSEKAANHLIFGSLMDNFITPQSTFSWWQSWLCQNREGNTEGKIIHSGQNFAGGYLQVMKNLTSDYYPESWTLYPIQ